MSKYIAEYKYYTVPDSNEEYSRLLTQQWNASKSFLREMEVKIPGQVEQQRKILLDEKTDEMKSGQILSELLNTNRLVFFDFLTQKIDINVCYPETRTKFVPAHMENI